MRRTEQLDHPFNRSLDAAKLVEKAAVLQLRIVERFPDRNLGRVCAEVHQVAQEAWDRALWIARPNWWLRGLAGLIILAIIMISVVTFFQLRLPDAPLTYVDFIQFLEAAINDLVLIGAAIFFLLTIENRVKRVRTLTALHELRSLAHVVDMHQLTKDPERLLSSWVVTTSSPQDHMTPFELFRYLDYCSEMLSLIGKIAALYVQDFDDAVALSAVNEIEDLTTGLSRKIWQKIMIIRARELVG